MQQGNYPTDNAGFFTDSLPNQSIPITEIQQSANSDASLMTSQPPPYPPVHQLLLPGMTSTFSQQLPPTHVQEGSFSTHHSYQHSRVPYQSYNTGITPCDMSPVRRNTPNLLLSPSNMMGTEQSVHKLSPTTIGMPRKSLVGMMSPIRSQIPPMNMLPPGSCSIQGPLSPMTVYMSSQSPQGRPHGNLILQNAAGSYLPQSPVYHHQQMSYAYSPQSHYSPQSSPVATSPRFITPARSQLSPLLQNQSPVHLQSPQSIHPSQAQFRAARQLRMGLSPNKVQPLNTLSSQHWQHAQTAQSASQIMWENATDSTVPSLPVLSSDTLDLLSTLTVSTVASQVPSSSISSITETRVQKSPLLQKHLLMPAPTIRTQSQIKSGSSEGQELKSVVTEVTTKTVQSPVNLQSINITAPPSRSNLEHGVRPTLIQSSKKDINPDRLVLSTCIVTTTLSSSSIVTSPVNRENIDKLILKDREGGNRVPDLGSGSELSTSMSDKNSSANARLSAALNTDVEMQMLTSNQTSGVHIVNSSLAECPSPVQQLSPEILEKRAKLCVIQRAKLKEKLDLYKECLAELFFLQNGGNCMDFMQFKKRPSAKLVEYLKKMMPDNRPGKKTAISKMSQESITGTSNGDPVSPSSDTSSLSLRKISSDNGKKTKITHDDKLERVLLPKVMQQHVSERCTLRTRAQSQDESSSNISTIQIHSLPKTIMSSQVQVNLSPLPKGQLSPLRLKRLSRPSLPMSLDESIGSQEEILERAKQEAVIQRKVVELRKQGLWTQRRLPKVQEPPRNKTHWDYLLEEMRWLSTDFAQERKWKRAAARKLVRTVNAYHKEQHDRVKRAEKDEQNRLRRIASTMAREIRMFWGNIGKVVEYKQRSLLDEKRQKALDLHLSFIVDQTEKYSDWLSQGLNQTSVGSSPTRSLNSSKTGSDDDFLPQGESSDDEETIAVAEQELEKSENCEDEISLLQQESQLPFDELINSLPAEVIQNIGKPLAELDKKDKDVVAVLDTKEETKSQDSRLDDSDSDLEDSDSGEEDASKPSPIALRRSARKRKVESEPTSSKEEPESSKKQKVESDANDEEFHAEQGSGGEDDEATVEEEEIKEDVDHDKEIEDLQAEGEMPIEELMKMYGDAFNQDPDQEEQDTTDDEDESPGAGEDSENLIKEVDSSEGSDEENIEMDAEEEEIGMDYLFKADLTKDDNVPMIVPADSPKKEDKKPDDGGSSPNKEITDVAAEAASLQPTGFTLATTQVVTPIPSLLKHTLREYQHIGLDWLVTMYDKRLNGILADEMGLGKTIQTIALLAHLACEKGVWGPHLIVVPTSVMLNWEMEFKKWCPGFKILTYYGSQKERKAKRTGWTKSNAFHVCITSYKLVLQDNVSFRRKKWKYLVLDEAQNIKNFKSQRWQTLLNFNSQRRLLLTGTPLQNNLMELWSLMHFLMPHVFQSHKEFKEWFSNPLTGMIEGSQEYNEKLVRRLHKVLRPFLLRRIKKDVEKQMPNKYEHVVRCHLSKRQRFLYEDFMSRASTKDTLDSGHFMSVINILMQLRKVCNHPNLFESRSIISPFLSHRIDFYAPSLITKVFDKSPFETLNLQDYHLHLPSLTNIHQYQAERIQQLQTPRKLIEELGDKIKPIDKESSHVMKTQNVREQLCNLLKERERLKACNAAILNLPQSLHVVQQQQSSQVGLQPVLTLPITSGAGTLQLTTSAGTTIFPSRVITIPQTKTEDSSSGQRTSGSQSFTLQYQTPQGTRVTIPNKQIRQLPGGVVQIMTSASKTSSLNTAGQSNVASGRVLVSSQGVTSAQNGPSANSDEVISMDVDKAVSANEKLDFKGPTSYVERLRQVLIKEQKQRCLRMASANEMRCKVMPEWLPQDTISHLQNIYRRPTENTYCSALDAFLKSRSTILKEMRPITDRFVFHIPKAESSSVDFHVSHPAPSKHCAKITQFENLKVALKQGVAPLHFINQATKIQFPEARLIQYDCGKLQVLNVLLRRFWREKHKCLIFTQMTKVLDVLEVFLSYHGYRYLRLDGSTKVEQRMLLMERFNNDPRIFCFILSTRSGGVGVNLTGADTVIFYDSDWNPTMDAQAQDRCHRIGQTRDVHIYRLISERTVEENILKKANQKRLLGDLCIEGGSFTTAFFKEQSIKELFNEPSGLEDLTTPSIAGESVKEDKPQVLSRPITARQKAIAAAKELEAKAAVGVTEAVPSASSKVDNISKDSASNWEEALQQTEDKEDVDAAKQLKEEQDADMEEFTENVDGEETTEVSRVQEEMKSLYEELTPIEKYALKYLEETSEEVNKEELELADEQVIRSKQDWEITHLMALKEEEERRLEEEEDEIFYTRDDAENQVNEGKKGGKKRRRKKERDICFLDMSSTSEEDNDGIDVETLENEEDMYEDIRTQEELEVNISPNKNASRIKKIKTPPKRKSRAKVTQRSGRGGKRFSGKRKSSPIDPLLSPSKRRRASELAYDIASHGYYQKDDFFFYNDDGNVCGEEPPWDEDRYRDSWSDREVWPDTPSEDNYSSDDSEHDDRTVCIVTDESPNKAAPGGYRSSSLWENSGVMQTGASGRGRHKMPLYNVVVETNATPKKTVVKPTAKSVTLDTITQRVNRTISFNLPTVGARLHAKNIVPTISLKPRPILRPVQPAKAVFSTSIPITNLRQIHLVPAKPLPSITQPRPLALNSILEQQATQRQKLQTYKIPLVMGSRAPPRNTFLHQQQYRPVLPQGQTFQIAGLPRGGTKATIIPLSQLGTTTLNLMPVSQAKAPLQPIRRVFTIGNPTGVTTQRKPAPSTVSMSSFNMPRQAYFIQHSKSGHPIHIITSSSAAVAPRFTAAAASWSNPGLRNVLRTNTGANVQTVNTLNNTKTIGKVLPSKIISAPFPQRTVTNLSAKVFNSPQFKKPELDRGIFDIVNSVEFMSPPLRDPDNATDKKDGSSLFDSLEQEFMAGDSCDLTIGSGDEDDMITLDLEPVSPSDPQLLNPSDAYDNEEERNVFESFQSLLEH